MIDPTETAALKLWLAAAKQESTRVYCPEDDDMIDALVAALALATDALRQAVGVETIVGYVEQQLADQGELAPVLRLIPGRRPTRAEKRKVERTGSLYDSQALSGVGPRAS